MRMGFRNLSLHHLLANCFWVIRTEICGLFTKIRISRVAIFVLYFISLATCTHMHPGTSNGQFTHTQNLIYKSSLFAKEPCTLARNCIRGTHSVSHIRSCRKVQSGCKVLRNAKKCIIVSREPRVTRRARSAVACVRLRARACT